MALIDTRGGFAAAAKIIDAVGDTEVVREWFAEQLSMLPEEVVFCD